MASEALTRDVVALATADRLTEALGLEVRASLVDENGVLAMPAEAGFGVVVAAYFHGAGKWRVVVSPSFEHGPIATNRLSDYGRCRDVVDTTPTNPRLLGLVVAKFPIWREWVARMRAEIAREIEMDALRADLLDRLQNDPKRSSYRAGDCSLYSGAGFPVHARVQAMTPTYNTVEFSGLNAEQLRAVVDFAAGMSRNGRG